LPLVFGLLLFLFFFFDIGQPELDKAHKGEQAITTHKHRGFCVQVYIEANSSFFLPNENELKQGKLKDLHEE